ncbi:MAG: EscU/YscU/HrcU family type III secretion system export apparatus switch protein [Pseudomonadota bacterium]
MAAPDPPRAKIKKAVALRYEPGRDEAHTLAALGRGKLAEKIIALAREHGVPIKEDPDLVEVLARLELDQEIPPELYLVVAEILAFVYQANARWQEHLARLRS